MADPRLRMLQEVLLQLASGDYEAQVPVIGSDDELDAICVGVNLLAQELHHERTQRQLAQAELQRTRAEQQQHERRKMQALAQLSGGVAHDLNNLLSVMMLVSAAVREPNAADRDALLDDLEGAIERGAELARQLLAVSVDTAKRLPVDPTQALHNAARLVRRAAPPGVEVSTQVPSGLPRVAADPGDLERTVLNLATNGLEAMPHGGRLSIAASRENGDVWVRVRDTGVGMDEGTRNRATEPLFTTKDHGTGFGLALAYTLCERAGGELAIDSAVGVGTTVALRLPAVDPAA